MAIERIPLTEFAERRRRLLKALNGAIGLVFAGEHDSHSDAPYRPHANFRYFTGVTDEPGAILLLDPAHPVAARREQLYLRPLNPEVEKWDGYRFEINSALRERTGFKSVFRLDKLAMFLNQSVRRSRKLACLHEPSAFDQPLTPDLEIFRKVAERMPSVQITDRSDVPAVMRAVKSKAEVAMIQRAVDITAKGFAAMMRTVRPGMSEFDVQETLEHEYRTNGARELAFPAIAGAGFNSTVLHYRANDQTIAKDDLICVDSGAAWEGYAADVTRTVPASGKFSKRQREVYEIVLKAQLAAIKAVRPGRAIAQIDDAARAIIKSAGFGDYFIHGIGHHLGLQTHDINPDAPLAAGAVITIEPGVYIPQEKIGIRIEDDVLVTKAGAKVLSSAIPKTAAEIEKTMARR